MKATMERLKYRLKKNKYITADHVRATICEVDELNQEDQTVAHLLKVAQSSGWIGEADGEGFYPSLLFDFPAQSCRLGDDQENRIWLMGAVSASKIRR
jgi:hypothetical protein